MLEHWAVMWTVLQRERGRLRKGFDDPLDAPEWSGLSWVLPIFSFLQSHRRTEVRPTRAAGAPTTEARWVVSVGCCSPKAIEQDR